MDDLEKSKKWDPRYNIKQLIRNSSSKITVMIIKLLNCNLSIFLEI